MNYKYDPIIFCQTESLNLDEFIVVTYIMTDEMADYVNRAGSVAVEQTTGTWMPVPDETPEVRKAHVGRVIGVYPIPGYEASRPEGKLSVVVRIAFPWVNIGQQFPELLSTVFGNISMTKNLKVLDIEFPKSFIDGFKGPQFGIEGLRELTGVKERPFVLAMIKPCTGIPVDIIQRQFKELAYGGIDFIKDDELIADPVYAPLKDRIEACMKVVHEVKRETGREVLYFPNITDRQDKMLEKAKMAMDMGCNALMVNVHACGYGAIGAVIDAVDGKVPILAHPAYAGASYLGNQTGLASHLVHGKFMRMDGADIVVYNCAYGKVPGLKERYIRVGQSLISPFHDLKKTYPSPCAGIHAGMIPTIMKDFGNNIVIGAGAGMHAHPSGIKAGIASLNQAAEAAMKDIPLEEYAKDHIELREALELWGVYDPEKSIYELTK
ncbi:MAG: RuBisCO large subunit C-terminal-like domain-containing protein [Tissierellia bacterium]|nr:RuBisCO large subunit C-terminal-like domain-containing protein [Tissierellia bacterium]